MTVDVHWWTGPRPGGRWHRAGTTVSIESLIQDGGPRPWRTLCGQWIFTAWTWADAPTLPEHACISCARRAETQP